MPEKEYETHSYDIIENVDGIARLLISQQGFKTIFFFCVLVLEESVKIVQLLAL